MTVCVCLTILLSAFLGVCVNRGVRPPGAKMEETSGTLGVTERGGELVKYGAFWY